MISINANGLSGAGSPAFWRRIDALFGAIPGWFLREWKENNPDADLNRRQTKEALVVVYNDDHRVKRADIIDWYERAKLLL